MIFVNYYYLDNLMINFHIRFFFSNNLKILQSCFKYFLIGLKFFWKFELRFICLIQV